MCLISPDRLHLMGSFYPYKLRTTVWNHGFFSQISFFFTYNFEQHLTPYLNTMTSVLEGTVDGIYFAGEKNLD